MTQYAPLGWYAASIATDKRINPTFQHFQLNKKPANTSFNDKEALICSKWINEMALTTGTVERLDVYDDFLNHCVNPVICKCDKNTNYTSYNSNILDRALNNIPPKHKPAVDYIMNIAKDNNISTPTPENLEHFPASNKRKKECQTKAKNVYDNNNLEDLEFVLKDCIKPSVCKCRQPYTKTEGGGYLIKKIKTFSIRKRKRKFKTKKRKRKI